MSKSNNKDSHHTRKREVNKRFSAHVSVTRKSHSTDTKAAALLKKTLHDAVAEFMTRINYDEAIARGFRDVIILDKNNLLVKISNADTATKYKLEVKLVKLHDGKK